MLTILDEYTRYCITIVIGHRLNDLAILGRNPYEKCQGVAGSVCRRRLDMNSRMPSL